MLYKDNFIVFFKHSSNFNMISEMLNIVYKWFNTLNIAQYISIRIYQLIRDIQTHWKRKQV